MIDADAHDMSAVVNCEPAGQPTVRTLAVWWRIGVRVVVVSAVVGLLVSTLEPTRKATITNVVYAECIGLSIFAMHGLLRTRWALRRGASVGAYLWRASIAVPVGYLIGVDLAALLRGTPVGLPALASMAPFALVLTLVTSAGLMYFFWTRNRIAEAAAARSDAQRTTAEARLKLLQTQIEPHMLFNTLANLRSLVEIDPPRAQAMIDQLIVYLRGTLAASRNTMTTLADEFAQLHAYLELMRVRMASRLRVEFDLPDALRSARIPPMLLQPVVENAVKHGLEPKVDGGTVRISVRSFEASLRIDVEDDGMGLRDEVEPGYGVTHVRDRLQLLYGNHASLAIEAREGGGVRVRLIVPA